MNIFKILLLIFNIFFICAGLVLVGIGIWTAATKIYVSFVIGDTLFSAASYLLIAVGVITVGVCILGIIGLFKEKTKLLMIYFGLLIFCFLVLITAAVLAIVFKEEVESVMVENMRESLIKGYYQDKEITEAWDQLQSELHCCAISEEMLNVNNIYSNFDYVDGSRPTTEAEIQLQDSWPIYKRTEFYKQQLSIGVNSRKYVPSSCCVYDDKLGDYANVQVCQYFSLGPPVNYNSRLPNDYLHYTGCYEKAKEIIQDQSDIIVALGFIFGFIMIAGMVLTFLILRSMSDDADMKRRREPDNL